MLKNFKNVVIKLFGKLGYNLEKKSHTEPVDLRNKGNSPRALAYYTSTDRQILIDVDFESGRGLEIFSLANNSSHPFIVAIKSALLSDDYKKALKTYLMKYYDAIQPKSASAWLGFDHGEVPSLDNEPPWLSLLPWENSSIQQKYDGRKDCAIYDNNEHGAKLAIDHGWRNFGPVSENVLEIEVNRLYALMVSIEKNGVLRNNLDGGDIGAIVLMKEDKSFCWMVEWGGQHRAAAISAMGYENVPIRVWQVVERADVNLWPNVQSGVFTPKSALKIFDKIFSGVPETVVTQSWNHHESK
ncbi:hypothetical protein [Colwellia sp. PAMC 21821]|uniref:hypothetical protein n=1 Tax=Colwellia sp. PAMC 21821 TaxID=1816219 RepID=UPI0009C14AE9|nr:hypothetical protein [Colwellia sp. PAMC 21821]ARD43588.1 hypothetical protein A3Q33_04255 [Colwellia sp. PAMC 21821]